MRTPNTQCMLCPKPLYRRPFEMAKTRYFACMDCRGKAQGVAGITERQQAGLALGRPKGTNHRTGYKHRDDSKQKTSAANKAFWEANPDRLAERGAKLRAERHYKWKGGASKLSLSIRQMTENRRWMDAVKARDGQCRCGRTNLLEAHHKRTLASLVESLGIRSREDARRHAEELWDLNNGETLCRPCHYAEHGRAWSCE